MSVIRGASKAQGGNTLRSYYDGAFKLSSEFFPETVKKKIGLARIKVSSSSIVNVCFHLRISRKKSFNLIFVCQQEGSFSFETLERSKGK